MPKQRKKKQKLSTSTYIPRAAAGYPARELTEDTRWIVCMWDIKGDPPELTAMLLKRSLEQVREIIEEAHGDGYYDKVKRHIEDYELRCPEGLKESSSLFRLLQRYFAPKSERWLGVN